MRRITLFTPIICLMTALAVLPVQAADTMKALFETESRNQKVLQVEAALAVAQANFDVIPLAAAKEIKRKADTRYARADDIAAEYKIVRHRMVALLNVWGRSLEGDAAQYLHYGATTVDIYDTVLVLQLIDATDRLLERAYDLESAMLKQAELHQATIMMGRTLGQHALPITFGKKISVWLGENRRHIGRLRAVRVELTKSAILKGAVGSYLGLGDEAMKVEAAFADQLGLATPYLADWHGTRDVFAHYAQVLGLIAKSLSRIGRELFLLQMTDINETVEYRVSTAVGSSTMPHKNNPSKSEALIQHGRTIPRLAEVVLDDVENYFERDNTSRPNRVLAEISIEADRMLETATKLIAELIVNEGQMRRNLDQTRGLMLSQRLAFALAPDIGKQEANDRMHVIAKRAIARQQTLEAAFLESDLAPLIEPGELKKLLDPTTYTGLAETQTRRVIEHIRRLRKQEGLKQ